MNYKLFFQYILLNFNYIFIDNRNIKNYQTKISNILIDTKFIYYITIHLKFASVFYSTQLNDMLSYELPNTNNLVNKKLLLAEKQYSSILIYNFHSIITQERFFVFTVTNPTLNTFSIVELFPAANWLERELSELHGFGFLGKKDLRNLMLQYGDTSSPFQKSFPTIGLKEIYYSSVKDSLVQNPIYLQL